MSPTNGRTPRTGERQLRVQYRNGYVSKWTYTAKQLVWADRGWDFDVVACEPADRGGSSAGTWNAVSGGY